MEIWADIPEFEGYQISNQGRVRSFWYRPIRGRGARRELGLDWHILPVSDDGNGYMKVCLIRDGKNYIRKIHRLVAEAFIPNPHDFDTVDHVLSGPEGKLDNSVENLQWMSRGDNIRKAWNDGVCKNIVKRSSKPVEVVDINTGYTMIFPSATEACRVFGLSGDALRHTMCKYGTAQLSNPYTTFQITYLQGKELARCDDEWEATGGLAYYDGYRYY